MIATERALPSKLESAKEVQLDVRPGVALQRLIEEVRADDNTPDTAYNRTYHRHNR